MLNNWTKNTFEFSFIEYVITLWNLFGMVSNTNNEKRVFDKNCIFVNFKQNFWKWYFLEIILWVNVCVTLCKKIFWWIINRSSYLVESLLLVPNIFFGLVVSAITAQIVLRARQNLLSRNHFQDFVFCFNPAKKRKTMKSDC
jgi:hypothetical protein